MNRPKRIMTTYFVYEIPGYGKCINWETGKLDKDPKDTVEVRPGIIVKTDTAIRMTILHIPVLAVKGSYEKTSNKEMAKP